jgi:hypothetical protein
VVARNSPYSESFSFFRTAISRTLTLWALEPVKYWSAAPHTGGSTTRRSTWRPLVVRTDDLVSPFARIRSTYRIDVNASMTGTGSSAATNRSMSPTVSADRRNEPA